MLELAVLLLLIVIPLFILFSWCCGAKKQQSSSTLSYKSKDNVNKNNSPAERMLERLHIDKKNPVITLCLEKNELESSSSYNDLSTFIDVLSTTCSIYIIIRIADEKEQQRIHSLLINKVPNFLSNYPQRVLFCSTEIGKVAFVRQIKPHLHIEFDPASYETLRPHVPVNIIHQLAIPRFEAAYGKRPYPNVIRSFADLQTLVIKV